WNRMHNRARARDRAWRLRAEQQGDAGQGERRSPRDDLHAVLAAARRCRDHSWRHDRGSRVHPPTLAGTEHRPHAWHAPSRRARTLRGERRARDRGERGDGADLRGRGWTTGARAHRAAAPRHHRRGQGASDGGAPIAQRARLTATSRVSLAAALLLGAAYAGTLAPGLTLWDAGELAAAVHTFGIPHQP